MMKGVFWPSPPEERRRLICRQINELDPVFVPAVRYVAVHGAVWRVSCFLAPVKGKFLAAEERRESKLTDTEERGKIPIILGYISHWIKEWCGGGMSGQNDRNSRGLAQAQPIIHQWVREKRTGQTKGFHRKDNNTRTWNCNGFQNRRLNNKHNEFQNVE